MDVYKTHFKQAGDKYVLRRMWTPRYVWSLQPVFFVCEMRAYKWNSNILSDKRRSSDSMAKDGWMKEMFKIDYHSRWSQEKKKKKKERRAVCIQSVIKSVHEKTRQDFHICQLMNLIFFCSVCVDIVRNTK